MDSDSEYEEDDDEDAGEPPPASAAAGRAEHYVLLYTESRGKQTYAKVAVVRTLLDIENHEYPTAAEVQDLHTRLIGTGRATVALATSPRPTKRRVVSVVGGARRKGPPRKPYAGVGPLSQACAAQFAAAMRKGTRGLPSKYRRLIEIVQRETFAPQRALTLYLA